MLSQISQSHCVLELGGSVEFIRQVPRRHRRFSTKFSTKASESTSLGRSLVHGINSPEIALNFSLTCLASCESMSRLVFILTFLSAMAAPMFSNKKKRTRGRIPEPQGRKDKSRDQSAGSCRAFCALDRTLTDRCFHGVLEPHCIALKLGEL